MNSLSLSIDGMHCASCVRRVEKAIAAVPGVAGAAVNLATERAEVAFDQRPDAAAVVAAIRRIGFEAQPVEPEHTADHAGHHHDDDARALSRNLIAAALLTLPVFAAEMLAHAFPAVHHWLMATLGPWNWRLQALLTALVLIGPGRQFFMIGLRTLAHGAPDMNALVAIGASAAFLYSAVATFAPALLPPDAVNVYYEAAAVIVTLILLGRTLEARAKGRAGDAIRKLIGLQPRRARVRRGAEEREVAIEDLRPGDIVLVRPGERIAVDGEVVEGASFVDEAIVTGEPVPVEKTTGASVTGGTINGRGSFSFRATKVGSETLLARIVAMVQAAQGAKLPVQALVDRIAAWFVPAVIVAALVTFLAWLALGPRPALGFALVNAVAVLIIACPCAMGLAVPISIMVGVGRGAGLGVLFRKGDALQRLRDVSMVALDKTGTLTEGRPELTDLVVADGFSEEEVLRLAAAIEAQSEHPVALAIVDAAGKRGIDAPKAQGFEALPGLGASATVEGGRIVIGADRLMAERGIDISGFAQQAGALAEDGKSPLFLSVDGRAAAMMAVADPIKASTPAAIRALHDLGLKVAMISGDNRRTAEAIARRLGIDQVVAEVSPAGKVEAIKRLADGGVIAFVGDGVNDAPALAAADIGIAIGTGTDIAIESAAVVLMAGRLDGVVAAIALSRATMRNIGQNLFWAFAYNVVLIPVAAGLLYPLAGIQLSPMLAAGAMALSSVFVVVNALRLARFRPREASA